MECVEQRAVIKQSSTSGVLTDIKKTINKTVGTFLIYFLIEKIFSGAGKLMSSIVMNAA